MRTRSKVVAKKPTASKAKASSKKSGKSATSSSSPGPANKLLVRLAKDPKIASAIENFDHGANNEKIENFRETVQTFMNMTKSFISSKRAVKLAAYVEVMIVAYRLGLVLKTNILDRPEVKQYLDENLEGLRESSVYKMARTFIGNSISKESAADEGDEQEEKAPTRSAKSKWNDGVRAKTTDEAEESDESEDEGPQLTRQQRRHEKEREANLSAMKNQGSSGPNRAAKRNAKGADTEEAHSDFIPTPKSSNSKASNKNAIKQ